MSLAGCSWSSAVIGPLCRQEAVVGEGKSDKAEWWQCSAPVPPPALSGVTPQKKEEHHHQIIAAVQMSPTQSHHQILFCHLAQKGNMPSLWSPQEHVWINDGSVTSKEAPPHLICFQSLSILDCCRTDALLVINSCSWIRGKINGLPRETSVFQGLTYVKEKAILCFLP